MMKKPDKCCGFGTFDCTVPMAINGRVRGIDYCIADIVAALNAANIPTVASCCGHGQGHAVKVPARIDLEDGRSLQIYGLGKKK
jgi:hypothetical protein